MSQDTEQPRISAADSLLAKQRGRRRRMWQISGLGAVVLVALGVAVAVTRTNDPGPPASQAYHWGYGEAQGPDRSKFLNIKTPLTDESTAASDCDRFLWEYANDNPVMITDIQPWHDAVNGCVDDLMGRKEHA